MNLAFSLLMLKVPSHWVDLVGASAPPVTWPLKDWVQDIVLRFVFLDCVLIGGLSKTPTYWLGGFFDPLAFLSIVQQVSPVSSSVVIYWGFIDTPMHTPPQNNRNQKKKKKPLCC